MHKRKLEEQQGPADSGAPPSERAIHGCGSEDGGRPYSRRLCREQDLFEDSLTGRGRKSQQGAEEEEEEEAQMFKGGGRDPTVSGSSDEEDSSSSEGEELPSQEHAHEQAGVPRKVDSSDDEDESDEEPVSRQRFQQRYKEFLDRARRSSEDSDGEEGEEGVAEVKVEEQEQQEEYQPISRSRSREEQEEEEEEEDEWGYYPRYREEEHGYLGNYSGEEEEEEEESEEEQEDVRLPPISELANDAGFDPHPSSSPPPPMIHTNAVKASTKTKWKRTSTRRHEPMTKRRLSYPSYLFKLVRIYTDKKRRESIRETKPSGEAMPINKGCIQEQQHPRECRRSKDEILLNCCRRGELSVDISAEANELLCSTVAAQHSA
ncbi:U3 small nucleolar ribonucleoprotein MPP10 [Balamuthia mandrillaris]